MENFKRSSTGSKIAERRLSPKVIENSTSVSVSLNKKRLLRLRQKHGAQSDDPKFVRKRRDSQSTKRPLSRLLQQIVSSAKVRKQMASGYRSQLVKLSLANRHVQDGNPGSNSSLSSKGRMVTIDRSHRSLFSCSNTQKFSKVSEVQCPKGKFPIPMSSLRPVDSSLRVYKSRQGGKTHGISKKSENSPVLGRLDGEIHVSRTGKTRCSKIDKPSSVLGLDYKLQEIRVKSNASDRFSRLHVRHEKGSGVSNRKEMVVTNSGHSVHDSISQHNPQAGHVSLRNDGFNGETNTIRSFANEATSVVPQVELESPSISRHSHVSFRQFVEALELVGEQGERVQRFTSSPKRAQFATFHRRVKFGLGGPFRSGNDKWSLDKSQKDITHKYFGVKSRVLGPKIFQLQIVRKARSSRLRQLDSSRLLEQTGRNSFSRTLCPSVENFSFLPSPEHLPTSPTHSREAEHFGRLPFSKGQNYSDRMVSPSKSD